MYKITSYAIEIWDFFLFSFGFEAASAVVTTGEAALKITGAAMLNTNSTAAAVRMVKRYYRFIVLPPFRPPLIS